MVVNDIASIIQADGKVTIVPNVTCHLTEEQENILLQIFTYMLKEINYEH